MLNKFSLTTTPFIFQSSWSSDLRDNLQVFLSGTLKSQEKPQLYNLFKKNSTELDRERKLHSEQLKKLQYQLTTKEQRLSQYHKRYTKIQVICSSDHLHVYWFA